MNTNLLLVLAAVIGLASSAKLPKNWKTCKRNDPKLNDCLKVAIQEAIGDLVKGVPTLGVLPLDPLHLIRLELNQGASNSPVAVNLTFMDIDFHGFKSAKLESVDVNWDKKKMTGHLVLTEPVVLLGKYKVSGKVLLLPIVGEGNCNFTLTNQVMDMFLDGSFKDKGGKKYFHVDKMEMKLQQDRVYMRLDNLFNGDKALGDNMNKFLDENWKEVYEAFSDTMQQGLAEAFREITNRVFDKVPFDQIAPPN